MRPARPAFGCAIVLCIAACTGASGEPRGFDAEAVASEIETALRAEIRSFEAKDCAAAVAYFADREPLFVVGGRPMPRRADLEAACPAMTARFPDGATRPVASEHVYAMGPDAGYSVTEFRIPLGPGGAVTSQFVTKVWSRIDGEWRIVHVHESLATPRP